MTATTVTLTYWVRDTFRFLTHEAAESSVYGGPDAVVEEVARTYAVGDRVAVRAFGRLRPGVVTAVARKTVTVNFRKNANGDTDERKFTAVEVTNERDALTAVGHILPDDHSTATLAELEETVAAMDAHRAADRVTECPACGKPAGHGPSTEGDCPLAVHPVPTAPLAVVTLDGEEQAVEVTATPEAPRYTAVRAEGRNKVLDRVTGKYTTCASRVAAEEKAAKLNRQHETETRVAGTAQAAEDAVTAVYERFAANRAAKDEDAATVAASIQTQGDFLTEVGALLGGSSLRQRASAARERAVIARDRDFGTAAAPAATETVASAEERAGLNALLGRETAHRTLEELAAAPAVTEDTTAADAAWDAAAAEIMASPAAAALAATVTPAAQKPVDAPKAAPKAPAKAKAPKAPQQPEAAGEKPAKLFSVWVGWRIADMLIPLADETPATDLSSIGGKLRDAKQGRRLARTIRLTPAEREALAGYATQVENDAVAGKDAPLADSARTLRARLA